MQPASRHPVYGAMEIAQELNKDGHDDILVAWYCDVKHIISLYIYVFGCDKHQCFYQHDIAVTTQRPALWHMT